SVCDAEGIDAGLVKGGTLTVATSAAQAARLRHRLEQERAWGDDAEIVRYLEKTELDDRLHVAGARGALYSPHCARVQPADLVAGLAETATRAGVRLSENGPGTPFPHRGVRSPARARRRGRAVPLRLGGGPRRRDRFVPHRAARPDPAPDVPGRGRGRPGARVVRRARRAAGLVRHGYPGPADRPGLGGRLHGPWGGRRPPGRAAARRPEPGRPQPAHS